LAKTTTFSFDNKKIENPLNGYNLNDRYEINPSMTIDKIYEKQLAYVKSKYAAKHVPVDIYTNWFDKSDIQIIKLQQIATLCCEMRTIFGNVFGGLKNLVKANVGPGSAGEIFLTYFKKISESFKNLETIDGKPLKEFFAGAAKNGVKLLDLLGNIVGGFIKLADNPELGVFLGQLNEVTTIFQSIGEDISKSLPSFGDFLIEFAKFVKLVTDSGSITIFFDTLRTALEKLNEFLGSKFGKKLLEVSAQILPLLAAIGLLGSTASFFGKVLLGPIVSVGKFAIGAKNLYSEIKF
jgi:hypothetical protein